MILLLRFFGGGVEGAGPGAGASPPLRTVDTVHEGDDAGQLTEIFSRGEVGLVVDDEKRLLGIITKMDLFDHLTAATPR